MRFCDLFLEYKLLLRTTRRTIKWRDLPLERKIYVMFIFVQVVFLIIASIIQNIAMIYCTFIIIIISFIIISILLSRRQDVKKILEEHYKPYSKKHIDDVINLLGTYKIDINDEDRLKKIIKMAQDEKRKNNPFLYIEKPTKVLFAAALPIFGYIFKRMADQANHIELLTYLSIMIAVVMLCLSIILAIKPFITMLMFPDQMKYEEIINDLEQIIIFKN